MELQSKDNKVRAKTNMNTISVLWMDSVLSLKVQN